MHFVAATRARCAELDAAILRLVPDHSHCSERARVREARIEAALNEWMPPQSTQLEAHLESPAGWEAIAPSPGLRPEAACQVPASRAAVMTQMRLPTKAEAAARDRLFELASQMSDTPYRAGRLSSAQIMNHRTTKQR